MKTSDKVRAAVVSGQFYPKDPHKLKIQMHHFLEAAKSAPDPEVQALIVPHAGYDYSGQVAGEAYKSVQGRRFDSVVVIAFLHRIPLQGVWVDDIDFYETPLGRIPVDRQLAYEIRRSHALLDVTVQGQIEEHSLEVQLPFLQTVISGLKIVPVYMGMQDLTNVNALSEAVAKTIKHKNVLVVATTDLSHFYPYAVATEKDHKTLLLFEGGNIDSIYEAYAREEAEACGMGPVLTSILLARKIGWAGPKLLHYMNSGDVTGDHRSVVGYAAMAYRRGSC